MKQNHQFITFLVFRQKFLALLSELHSTCPEEHFEEKNFETNSTNHNFFGLQAKKWCCQNSTLCVQRNNLGKMSQKKLRIYKHFWTLRENFDSRCQNCVLHLHRKKLSDNFVSMISQLTQLVSTKHQCYKI